jgi:hypothetical protein
VHVPHDVTVRDAPQLSLAVTLPQFLPSRVQNTGSVSAVQPHTFATDGVAPPHVCGKVHDPQFTLVRLVPQLSAAVTVPQFLPSRVQNAGSVSAVQPHTFATDGVAPPHVCGEAHVPHEATVRLVPQLSLAVRLPQFLPCLEQNTGSVSAVQPHTFATDGVAPPHVCGEAHVPHEATVRLVPQLSAAVRLPQFLPCLEQNVASLSAVQPHTLATDGVAPPHVCGEVHVPQFTPVRVVPQLSAAVTVPQFFPSRVQNTGLVSAVQPHTFAVPPPPHVTPVPLHVPHPTVLLVPQLSAAVTLPQFFPSRLQNVVSPSYVQPHTFAVPPPPHVTPVPLHVPHPTVLLVPQLSGAVTLPQFFPSRLQNVVSPSYVQPHTFAVPPPPHVTPVPLHVPHPTVLLAPQLSGAVTLPQFLPNRLQNVVSPSYVQPHTFVVPPPPHVTPVPEHVPQLAVRGERQLSLAVKLPQFLL